MPDPINIRELAKSRNHSVDPKNPRLELQFVVWFTTDDQVVRDVMLGTGGHAIAPGSDLTVGLPGTFYGLTLLGFEPSPAGGGVWFVTARYGVKEGVAVPPLGDPPGFPSSPPPPTPAADAPLGNEWNGTTTGGTAKIYQYRAAPTAVKAGGGAAPDYKWAINPTKDGVDGIEVVVPKFEVTFTGRPPALTLSYLNTLMNLTGCINNADWMHQNEQEWLFLGADFAYREREGFTVVWKFALSPEEANFVVSSDITIPLKHGWDYVSVIYSEQTSNGYKVQQPLAAYCGRVYPTGDFTQLGLGGD